MEGSVNVCVEFLDGRPNMEVKMGAAFPVGQEMQACLKMLAQINMAGGILEFLADGVALIPLASIKKLTLSVPAIQLVTSFPSGI